MKTTKKQKKSNLKVSLLLLLLAAVLLISSTYAWFVANTAVSVETIKVKINTVEGLQISVDASTWKSTVTNLDITSAGATYTNSVNQLPGRLKPCSTIGDIENGNMKIFGQTDESATYTGTDLDENGKALSGTSLLVADPLTDTRGTEGKYIAFDVFFNLQSNESKKLFLTPQSQVTFDTASAEADTNINPKTTKGLENAARIAFIVEGYAQTADAATAREWKYEAANADCKFVLWEPNSNTGNHTQAAIDNGTTSKPSDVPAYDPTKVTGETAVNPLPYSGVKSAISANDKVYIYKATAGNFPAKFGAVTPTIWTDAGFTDNKDTTITLKPGITKMRIYMWIEGQDIDCWTGASGTYLNFDLQFKVDAAAQVSG